METKIARLEEQMKAVVDKIDSLGNKVDQGFCEIKQEMKLYVTKEMHKRDIEELREETGRNTGNWDWVVKTVMGLIIGALITILITRGV